MFHIFERKPFEYRSEGDLFVYLFVLAGALPVENLRPFLILPACMVLIFPSLFWIYLVYTLIFYWAQFPDVAMNRYMIYSIGILLIVYISTHWKDFFSRSKTQNWFDDLAPVLRAALIVIYFFAFLAKLNLDYFNIELTCVHKTFRSIFRALQIPIDRVTPEIAISSAWISVVLEASLPLLLMTRKFRKLALILGGFFHIFLAFAGHFHFSLLMCALYLPFFPKDLLEKIVKSQIVGKLAFLSTVVLLLVLVFGSPLKNYLSLGVDNTNWALFFIYFVSATTFFYFSFYAKKGDLAQPSPHQPFWKKSIYWIFPIFVFINGLAAYLGLKTMNTYTMFSNLRVGGGVTNHFFMSPQMEIFDFQKNTIKVEEVRVYKRENEKPDTSKRTKWSRNPIYKWVPYRNFEVPIFEVRRVVHRLQRDFSLQETYKIRYWYEGQFYESDLVSDPLFANSEYSPLEKILSFRIIPAQSTCLF